MVATTWRGIHLLIRSYPWWCSVLNRWRRIRWCRLCFSPWSHRRATIVVQMIFSFQVCCPYLQLLALSKFVSLSEQPEVVWVGLVSVLRVSLPPVSILCEEFDCVPVAGATACPEKENALSLLSCSVICKARGYPLVGSVGDLRLITCESEILSDMYVPCWYWGDLLSLTTDKEIHSFGMTVVFSEDLQ